MLSAPLHAARQLPAWLIFDVGQAFRGLAGTQSFRNEVLIRGESDSWRFALTRSARPIAGHLNGASLARNLGLLDSSAFIRHGLPLTFGAKVHSVTPCRSQLPV